MSQPHANTDIHTILHRYWGYEVFRPLQEDIIRSILNGHDTLALMPTGGGKSITYQVSGIALGGLTLVVSPLIALMKDQVEDLKRRGIPAETIHTGIANDMIESTINKCIHTNVRFLYVSPERLASTRFREKLRRMPVRLIAVDEAHCISQWGYDFRPSYLRIADIREFFPGVVVLALTATATPDVAADIQKQLRFATPHVLAKSFRRTNLSYIVRETSDRVGETIHILTRMRSAAIVYVRQRKNAEDMAAALKKAGISADYYHAGLPPLQRSLRQEAWKNGSVSVIVATNAFGMGIDKPDVRVVVHYDIPDSLEAYFQEAGRAGRDGLRAYAVLLHTPATLLALKRRPDTEFPDKSFVKRVYAALGDHFQIGEGEGQGHVFEFNAERFTSDFQLDSVKTHAAIDILSVGGYIECTTDINSRARVTFLVTRDELNMRDVGSPLCERLLVLLMRNYPGIFVQDVYVDEDRLAEDLSISRHELYETFIALARLRIIRYVPGDDKPYIIYLQPRLPLSYINLSRNIYEDRRNSFIRKNKAMAAYIESPKACRQLYLMEYFGQHETVPCGVCDLCLSHKKTKRQTPPDGTRLRILELLAQGPMSPGKLVDLCGSSRKKAVAAIRTLLDEGRISTFSDDKLALPPKN